MDFGASMFTYGEALERAGSRHALRKLLDSGDVRRVSRNLYCERDDAQSSLAGIFKLYPNAIVTGLTALYLHGLIDMPPDRVDVATKRGGTKIRSESVHQSFIPGSWLDVGASRIVFNGEELPVYDIERMLLELMRSRNKMPHDLYREAVRSYRERAAELDIYKLEDYAAKMPRGGSYLERAMEEVL